MKHELYMKKAYRQAEAGLSKGEIPVGAIVVLDGKVIGRGHNRQLSDNDPSAHAEIVALRRAGNKNKNFRLDEAQMYVTIEPCVMCKEAIRRARIKKVYYASYRAVKATHKTSYKSLKSYSEESCSIMKEFFRRKR